MDVRLSAEQEALRDSVTQVVDRLGPSTVAQLDDGQRASQLDAAVTESGWRDLRAGTDEGGPLASGVEAALVAEELGRGVADASFIGPTLAVELRRLAGAPTGASVELRRLAGAPTGASVETVAFDPHLSALSRAAAGEAPAALGPDAQGSAMALLLVPERDGHRVAQVGLGARSPGPDLTRPIMAVNAGSVMTPVAGADRLVTDDELRCWTALGLALACADLVGVMAGAVRLACDYASERRQYGASIGSFQSIAHLLADAHVMTEGSRSITLHAAWAVDALPATEALAAAALAKAYCTRAARSVCETAIQVHGGIGNTWECMAHVYLRRALLSSALLGGEGASLARIVTHEGIGVGHGLR